MKVSLFLVTLFAIATCIYAENGATLSTTGLESDPKRVNFILPRVKRQVYDIVNQRVPSGLQPGEQQTIIVIPERGGNGYRGGSNSQYGTNNNDPNRGTRVVVSQEPEHGHNGNSRHNS